MSNRPQLTNLPLQALRQALIAIATGLRAGGQNGGALELLDLRPLSVCKNALGLLRQSSPALERLLLTLGPFIILVIGLYRYLYQGLFLHVMIKKLQTYFRASVTVPATHKLHGHIKTWLSKQNAGVDNKRLCLSGTGRVESKTALDNQDDKNKTAELSYIPDVGSSSFWFNGRRFTLERSKPETVAVETRNPYGQSTKSDRTRDSDLVISCYSIRGAEPIKKFLEHVRTTSEKQTEAMTTFHRVAKSMNYQGAFWDRGVTRKARKLDAISMEHGKKTNLVNDIETYLAPESKTYYLQRGIPHRRGYLFYGPPGSGKTSFATAIAGHFGLSIFFISLSTPNLDDDKLEELFDDLPPKCLVLLEDIDSAGITRETMKAPAKPKAKADPFGMPTSPKKSITLSGLLNVIDGPCSHEGRVLIMTSNSPDSLDAALVRPGRIDRKILFGNAVTEVMESLFVKIFTGNPAVKVSSADIVALSKKFSAAIPDDKVAPCEIQNYLLENRTDPVSAANDAAAWAEALIATKASGKNVAEFAGNITSDTQTTAGPSNTTSADATATNADATVTAATTTDATAAAEKTDSDTDVHDSGIDSASDTDSDADADD